MAGVVPTLFWFDRFEERIGILPVAGEFVHAEEINGEDTIEFSSWEVPAKGDRLLWKDGAIWREHIVVRTEEPLVGPCEVYAESSFCEMLGDYIVERRLVNSLANAALAVALDTTRWEAGTSFTGRSNGCLLYHMNALEAIHKVADVWEGELAPVITVANGQVASRAVRMPRKLGTDRGLRFTYSKNMAGCTRTVLEDDVITAMYGYGQGLPVTDEDGNFTGGYRRKLTFGDINGGKDYVEDADALASWGRWDAERREKQHFFGQVTFSDCDDKYSLLYLTRRALQEAKEPQVSYELDVAALDGADAGLGDTVSVVDTSRTPEWRFKARIVRRVRTFSDCVLSRVTIGKVQRTAYSAVSTLSNDVATLANDVVGIDGQLSAAATTENIAASVEGAVDNAVENLTDLGESEF